jgi:phenylalanyl-tRNA synthetase beta chain
VIASLYWLRDFLGDEITATQVRDLLTARCATVEAVTPVRSDLAEVVVARVVEVERHPDADNLWLTRVDAGTGELVEVVCGAANVQAGTFYPFAPVGATLPGGVKIEKRKIRGRVSHGMLCSAAELGLGTDRDGILELDGIKAKPGARFTDVADGGDFRFDIDVLPNRPDLLSHHGLARELSAALKKELQTPTPIPDLMRGRTKHMRAKSSGMLEGIKVRIDDPGGCPRYTATIIRGVKVGPSPRPIAERLQSIGLRSVNNVVDVTNYMLHGFGQPMHAFDLEKLGREIVIRRATPGEHLITLDGVGRVLPPDIPVIASVRRAEAIGGVIGGQATEVTDDTTDILLEAAAFNPKRIRQSRRALGISTDASYRFERHVDIEAIPSLAETAAILIATVGGGTVSAGPLDLYAVARKSTTVSVRPSRVTHVLGEEIGADRVTQLLRTAGFIRRRQTGGTLGFAVPSWRSDVSAEIDLIEEVARLHGYDEFSSELRPFRPSIVPDDPLVPVMERVRDGLVSAGLMEIRPMPFVAKGPDERLRVRNPLAENEAYLRGSLLETLARRAEHNLAQMRKSVRLFEIGTVFRTAKGPRPDERTYVGAVLMGAATPPHFTGPEPRSFDAWDVKWVAELVADKAFGSGKIKFGVKASPTGAGTLWRVERDGIQIGRIVRLELDAPAWAAPAFAFELDITDAAAAGAGRTKYRQLPVTPAAELDIALVVSDEIPAERVEAAIRKHGGDILEAVTLFDEFRGTGIEPGSRSLAWRLTFRHPGRTLREEEVEARREALVRVLEKELGVRQRAS